MPLSLTGIVLIVAVARSLARAGRESVVMTVPLGPRLELRFDRAGPYVLSLEGKLLSSDFAGLQYRLIGTESGLEIPLRRVPVPLETSGFSRVRVEARRFDLAIAGGYTLSVAGPGLASADSADSLVVTRPVRASAVLHILALIVLGALTVGSMVGTGLILARGRMGGLRPASAPSPGAQPPLEYQIGHAAAVILARTVLHGAVARYRVLETWKGTLHPLTAGLGTPEGLYLDSGMWERWGYRPVDGQEVVLMLLPLPGTERGASPSNIVPQPLEVLPVIAGQVTYATQDAAVRRELDIDELRSLVTRAGAP